MAAFAVEVEAAVLLLVEVHAPVHESPDAFGAVFHHLRHGSRVGDEVARHHRVLNMFFEVVNLEVRH